MATKELNKTKKNQKKLYGPEVILAHRLLKNILIPDPLKPKKKISRPVVKHINIDNPPSEVFDIISNLELRSQ